MSALYLAFGLSPGLRVGLIDTEHGSGDLYAHLGDYDVISLEPPFTVPKYRDAIRAFEEAGYDTIIVDSLSHAWSGEGGLLDKQGQLENSGKYKNSFATWREITPEHHKLVEEMLGSPAHIVATMRTKTEYVIEKDDRGKNTVRKIGLSPVQRDGVEYEFTTVLDVAENHTARASKDRTSLFDSWCDRISTETGRMLRQWLDSGAPAASGAEPIRAAPARVNDSAIAVWLGDGIPALDDEPEPPPEPTPQRRPTIAEWLRALEVQLSLTTSREETEAHLLSEAVLKASRTLQGHARQRLREIAAQALARFGDPEPA